MPFHFCSDELIAILAIIPFIGAAFTKLHIWWHMKFKHKCHTDPNCKEIHAEHNDK